MGNNIPSVEQALQYPELFIKWCEINHGDHGNTNDTGCEVHNILQKNHNDSAFIDFLLAAVIDTEGDDWQESWLLFLNEQHQK